jgi:hypothetical protein
MTEGTLRRLKSDLVGKRDDRSRAQRQVITEELRRRRDEEKANRVTAQERRARAQEIRAQQQKEREEREAAQAAERRQREEAAAERAAAAQARSEARDRRIADVSAEVDRNVEKERRRVEAAGKGKSADELRDEAKAATEAIEAYNRRDTVRDGRPGYIAPTSPEYDHNKGAQMNERAAAAYRVAAASEEDENMRRALEHAADQHQAVANRHRAYAAGALRNEDDPDNDTRRIMTALSEVGTGVSNAQAAVRAAEASRARREQADRERAQREADRFATLDRINESATGRSLHRKKLTPEERELVNGSANRLATDDRAFERARRYEDESAQTNRVDVLKARAFAKARDMRIKNGWGLPGEQADQAPERSPEPQSEADRLAGARARLQESADRRKAARDNRPEEVTRDVAAAQRAAETYRSNLGRGRISHVSDEKLAQLHALVRRLSLDTNPDMLDRQETKALVELQHMVTREVSRRRSQR